MDLEFLDGTSETSDDPQEDVLSGPAGRLPRWFTIVLVAAVAGIAVVVLAQGQSTPQRPAAAPSSAPATTFGRRPVAPADETLAAVYLRGRDPAPARNIVRSGSETASCRPVRIGSTPPQHSAAAALRRTLTGFRIVDTSLVLDPSAGLCALQVRARDTTGTTALIVVVSPVPVAPLGRHQVLEAHSGTWRGLLVEYAQFRTRSGWTILTGTSGPDGRQPPTTVLEQLAVDPALRW